MLNYLSEFIQFEGLFNDTESSFFDEIVSRTVRRIAGYDDDLDVRIHSLELLETLMSAHLRHDHVEDDYVDVSPLALVKGRCLFCLKILKPHPPCQVYSKYCEPKKIVGQSVLV